MTFLHSSFATSIAAYRHVTTFGKVVRLEYLQMPDEERAAALSYIAPCIACGTACHPLRARLKSKRARTAESPSERRLFYAPTCSPGCSRTQAAREHADEVRRLVGHLVVTPSITVEVHDASGVVLLRLGSEVRERVEMRLPRGAAMIVFVPRTK